MALADEIAKLQADVTAETSANQAAITLINGFASQLAAAVAAAAANGATPDQLAALQALETTISQNSTTLASAVTANTPAAAHP